LPIIKAIEKSLLIVAPDFISMGKISGTEKYITSINKELSFKHDLFMDCPAFPPINRNVKGRDVMIAS
jgi:hypothetical protein